MKRIPMDFIFRDESLLPKWRNWQTRQVQDLVPLTGVEVRVLSSALQALKGVTARSRDPFRLRPRVGGVVGVYHWGWVGVAGPQLCSAYHCVEDSQGVRRA